jgi:dTDP-4-amino-4,6-dideoxygalactose transaminase
MTDIQGALGNMQMERASAIINERREIAQKFNRSFSDIDQLQTPFSNERFGHGYQSYACLLNLSGSVEEINRRRNSWMEELQSEGISTRPATHAVHMLTYYSDKYKLTPFDFPNAFKANHCSISLPLFHGMLVSEQDRVIDVVRRTIPH